MGRIMALDYGGKRTGIAVTDPEQIIASPLATVPTHQLLEFLRNYFSSEQVETVVLGFPVRPDQSATHNTAGVIQFEKKFREEFRALNLELMDERFTSKMAVQTMIAGGMKKKDRRKKGNIDKISAVIILQDYMKENGLW